MSRVIERGLRAADLVRAGGLEDLGYATLHVLEVWVSRTRTTSRWSCSFGFLVRFLVVFTAVLATLRIRPGMQREWGSLEARPATPFVFQVAALTTLAAPLDRNLTANAVDVGKDNVTTPVDTYLDGQLADLRVISAALPCQ
jgi:hypothetical protein